MSEPAVSEVEYSSALAFAKFSARELHCYGPEQSQYEYETRVHENRHTLGFMIFKAVSLPSVDEMPPRSDRIQGIADDEDRLVKLAIVVCCCCRIVAPWECREVRLLV